MPITHEQYKSWKSGGVGQPDRQGVPSESQFQPPAQEATQPQEQPTPAQSEPYPASFDKIVELITTGRTDEIPGIKDIPLKVSRSATFRDTAQTVVEHHIGADQRRATDRCQVAEEIETMGTARDAAGLCVIVLYNKLHGERQWPCNLLFFILPEEIVVFVFISLTIIVILFLSIFLPFPIFVLLIFLHCVLSLRTGGRRCGGWSTSFCIGSLDR